MALEVSTKQACSAASFSESRPVVVVFRWPAAEWLQPYSIFHYLKAKAILTGMAAPFDLAVLGSVILMAMAWALVVFPRRDLAAPS